MEVRWKVRPPLQWSWVWGKTPPEGKGGLHAVLFAHLGREGKEWVS